MNHRKDIIPFLCNKFDLKGSYLELGLRGADVLFNHVPCKNKHAVDINCDCTYRMSTDLFFEKLDAGNLDLPSDYKWDIIFIDANHLANFVYTDFVNSLNHLTDGGILLLHDILPHSYNSQHEFVQNQTAWKAVPFILKNHPEVHLCSIPEVDGGMGVIIKNSTGQRPMLSEEFNRFSEYYIMDADRKYSQNLIEFTQLEEWIENPYYYFNDNPITDLRDFTNVYHKLL